MYHPVHHQPQVKPQPRDRAAVKESKLSYCNMGISYNLSSLTATQPRVGMQKEGNKAHAEAAAPSAWVLENVESGISKHCNPERKS